MLSSFASLPAAIPDMWSTLFHQFGLLAGTVLIYSTFGGSAGSRFRAPLTSIGFGLLFGSVAVLDVLFPIGSTSAVHLNPVYAILMLSAACGGPSSAITVTVLICGFRWVMDGLSGAGDLAATGFVGITIAAVSYLRGTSNRAFAHAELLLLCAAASWASLFGMLFLRSQGVAISDWFAESVLNTTALLAIGFLLSKRSGILEDQSKLRSAVEVQSQLAQRYQVVTNNVADGVLTLDEAGIVHSFNSSAEWIFGWVGEEIVGRHISILLPDDNEGGDTSRIANYLKTGKAGVLGQDGSLLGQRKNGGRFPVELRLAEFTLEGGRFFAASARDLSKARAAEERRAAAERRTRISEMRFRDCATASSDYLWETDADHRFTYWMGGQHLAGLYPTNVIGQKRWEVAEADPQQEPWRQHLECLATRKPFKRHNFTMRTLDGRMRWFKSSGVPFFNEDGSFGGYRGASSDITEAVEAERQLQARAEQQHHLAVLGQLALQDEDHDRLFSATIDVLRLTLRVPTAALFEIDADRTQLRRVVARGSDSDAIEVSLVPLSDQTVLTQALSSESVVDAGSLINTEFLGGNSCMAVGFGESTRRSGVVVVCDSDRVFDPDERNFFRAVAVIVGAAVERRRAEASLALRDRALESIGHGFVIADATKPGAPAVYVNSAFAQTRRRTPEDLVGSGLAELFSERDGYDAAAQLRDELEAHGHFAGCLKRKLPAGEESWEDICIKPLRDGVTPTHFVCLQTDVTSRVKMEIDLRQAQKMDAVGKLTGGVAHDFNNLLTVILGNAEVLSEDLNDPRSKHTAALILDAAERGSDLVQRLLTFGRRQALQPEYVDLDCCVANIAALLDRTIGADIRLRTELMSEGATSFVDKSHLETAILNLVTNARDAMVDGGTLTIATRVRDIKHEEQGALRPGRYLSLSVADTGSGMPPEVKQRVFEPFFTTKQFGKGTGLGLASVYGFVQQSCGHIRLETEVGRGTNVEILLPCANAAANHEEATLQPSLIAGGERILLVEDQADLCEFVSQQLGSLGYDVVAVSSAPEALDVLGQDREVHLLFTDILLPSSMNGFQLAERALSFRPNLRLLFTSGYSDYAVERQSRLLEMGAPLLKKPYRRLELASAVREAIERGSFEYAKAGV